MWPIDRAVKSGDSNSLENAKYSGKCENCFAFSGPDYFGQKREKLVSGPGRVQEIHLFSFSFLTGIYE